MGLFEYSLPPQVSQLREKGRLHMYKNNKCKLSTNIFFY